LADFVVDWTSPTHSLGEDMVTPWVVHCDGAWCHKGIRYAARLVFTDDVHSTNNTTEYEALLLASNGEIPATANSSEVIGLAVLLYEPPT
jgi:hypothetical protein